MKKRIISLLVCIVMCMSLLPATASAAGSGRIDFVIQDYDNVKFPDAGNPRYISYSFALGQPLGMKPPIVVRTDSDDKVFDGWYTERTGGVKVTADSVFSSYTVVYDHWIDAPVSSNKTINSIEINNSSVQNGDTSLDYSNNSTAPTVTVGSATNDYAVSGGVNFEVYKGAYNNIRFKFTDSDRMNSNVSYTVVTTIDIKSGYKIDKNTQFYAKNGSIFTKLFLGNINGEAVACDEWFAGASRVKLSITLKSPIETPYFVVNPTGGTVKNGERLTYTFELSELPSELLLQYKVDNNWISLGEVDPESDVFQTPIYSDRTMTFRLLVTRWALGVNYTGQVPSHEFTVTWAAAEEPGFSFVTQPKSGTAKKSESYAFSFELSETPVGMDLQIWRSDEADWGYVCGLRDSSGSVSYDARYCEDGISRYRIFTCSSDRQTFIYSNEFTVTWTEDTPDFSFVTQPKSGTAKKSESYAFSFELSETPVGMDLQIWRSDEADWGYVCGLRDSSGSVSYDARYCEDGISRYRIFTCSSDRQTFIYSNEFTVTWTEESDFSFVTQPKSGTAKKSESYAFSFELSETPVGMDLQIWRSDEADWGYVCGLRDSSGSVSYDARYCEDGISRYRIFTCSSDRQTFIYSNEFTVTWTEDTPDISIVNYTASFSADYKSTLVFHTDKEAPEGYKIVWSNGQEGQACKLDKVTEKEYKVSAKLVKISDSTTVKETQTETVTVNTGFFAKIVAFFRDLFGKLPTYEDNLKK